jgi:hypothetical protein
VTTTKPRAQLRQVVDRVSDGAVMTITLDCGHRQERPHVHLLSVPKHVLCFECGEESR